MCSREHTEKRIRIALDDDAAEELEMMLSPEFRQAMVQLDTAVAEGRFDLRCLKFAVISSLGGLKV